MIHKQILQKTPTKAQQRILQSMKEGQELYEILHLVDGSVKWRSGTLNKPNTHRVTQQTILISTINALLRQNLIVECKRWLASSGTWEGLPHEGWHVDYKLAE